MPRRTLPALSAFVNDRHIVGDTQTVQKMVGVVVQLPVLLRLKIGVQTSAPPHQPPEKYPQLETPPPHMGGVMCVSRYLVPK
jgi:hypothetical protein